MKRTDTLQSFKVGLDTCIGAYLGTTGAIGASCITSGQFPSLKIVLAALLLTGIPSGLKTLQSRLALAPGQKDAALVPESNPEVPQSAELLPTK